VLEAVAAFWGSPRAWGDPPAFGGPSMNIKGTAAGGGNSLLIPMTEFPRPHGDIDAVTNAHNLALVALTARLHHETKYSDEALAKRGLKRLWR